MSKLQDLADAIVAGDSDAVGENTTALLQAGLTAKQILDEGLIAGMNTVGALFREGDLFIPEVLLSSRAMHTGLDVIGPLLADGAGFDQGRVVLGTIEGDIHDIGKSLIATMLQGAGFTVIDLGVDVPPQKYVEAVLEQGAHAVGLSALLTTTMVNMKSVIQAFEEAGLRSRVPIIIGGAPVTQQFADLIGADGYAPDAARAVDLVRRLIADRKELRK